MDYQLYHGDCLDYFGEIAPASIDAVICDPPYGTTACKWDSVIPFALMWAGIKRVLKPRGACVLFGSQPFTSALVMSNPSWFRYEWVWNKKNPTGFLDANRKPMKQHENIVVFSDGRSEYHPLMRKGVVRFKGSAKQSTVYGRYERTAKAYNGDYFPTSIIEISGADQRNKEHPTQKPLALLEYLIKTYTNEGECILDFTMGSGTTGAACGNLGRRFIGIEKDADYFAQGSARIATAYAPLRMMEAV